MRSPFKDVEQLARSQTASLLNLDRVFVSQALSYELSYVLRLPLVLLLYLLKPTLRLRALVRWKATLMRSPAPRGSDHNGCSYIARTLVALALCNPTNQIL